MTEREHGDETHLDAVKNLLTLTLPGVGEDDWWDRAVSLLATGERNSGMYLFDQRRGRVTLTRYGRLVALALGCVRVEGRCECGLCEWARCYEDGIEGWVPAPNDYEGETRMMWVAGEDVLPLWQHAMYPHIAGGPSQGCPHCLARCDADGWATLSPLYNADKE